MSASARFRGFLGASAVAAAVLSSGVARADELLDDEGAPRTVALELYPLDFLIGRYGAGAEIMLASHHALGASAYFASVSDTNAAGATYDLRGVGGELGYRFYTGARGMRGFFGGPSLLAGAFDLSPPGGAAFTVRHYGVAFDFGYQALVADDFVLALGAGAEWLYVDKTTPDFASINASSLASGGLRPRVLATLGWAF